MSFAGLDARHTALLRALDGRSELSGAEFEELAERLDLLADGAYETLNEAAFDGADSPLLVPWVFDYYTKLDF